MKQVPSTHLVILPEVLPDKTEGGIIVPDQAKEKPKKGTVVMVGEKRPDDPIKVEVGDEVYFGRFAGADFEEDDKKYKILKKSDVLLVL